MRDWILSTICDSVVNMHRNTPDPIAAYCLRGHESVAGWLQPGATSLIWSLIEVQKHEQISGDVAEIGVWHGKLFILLSLSLAPSEKANAVDPFEMPGYPNFIAAFQRTLAQFEIPPDKVVTHQMRSEHIPLGRASSFLGERVRFISLDGEHRRVSIVHDLRLAKEVLSDFGVIVVDDIFSAWAPSVTEGIIDFLRQDAGDIVPFALAASDGPLTTGCAKVFLCKESAKSFYTDYLRRLNGGNLEMTTDFCDHSILVFDFEKGVEKKQLLE